MQKALEIRSFSCCLANLSHFALQVNISEIQPLGKFLPYKVESSHVFDSISGHLPSEPAPL